MFRAWLTKGLLIAVLAMFASPSAFADTICCKRGNADWWTSSYKCTQAGGHQVANKQCRNDNNNGGNFGGNFSRPSWWLGDGSNRVCCQRWYQNGWQDWWSTARDCVRAGGNATANKVCRSHTSDPPYYPDNQWNNQWNNGQWNDPYNNPNRRVCCYRDGQAWWSSWIDCKRGWGQETANKVCRNN